MTVLGDTEMLVVVVKAFTVKVVVPVEAAWVESPE